MRHLALLLFVLGTLVLFATADDGTTALDLAVQKFGSADPLVRDDASRKAAAEVKRLLQPLLAALEDPDPEVRRRARAAITMQLPLPVQRGPVPSWHPRKAAGPPDAIANQDHPNAWASKRGDMGLQWLALRYRKAMVINQVRIFEVNSAGAVAEVIAVDDKGKRHSIWKGKDPTARPGVFAIKIPATKFKVASVRIVLDTNRAPGWNEIDAVEIVGPNGRQWAVDATASSSYAQ